MNIKKTLAAFAAAAIAASAISVSASAIDMSYYVKSDNNMIYVLGGGDEPSWSTDYAADPTTVYGVQYTLTNTEPGTGLTGKVVVNSTAGWNPVASWGSNGNEDIAVDEKVKSITVKWCSDSPIFTADDTWCQFALQCYSGSIKVTGIEILDKDGNPINLEKPAAPAEEEAADETAEAAEETAVEETAAEPEAEEAVEEEAAPAPAPVAAISGDVLFEGEATSSSWGQAVKLMTLKNDGGVLDPEIFNEDKVVVVYYSAATAPEMILQSWSGGEGWAKVPANEDLSTDGVAVFTWDYMTAMYQSEDLTETLDCFYIGDTDSDLTVSKVVLADAASLNAGAVADEEEVAEEVVEEAPAVVETEAPVVEAPAATPVANTGNTAAASIAAVMALAGVVSIVSKRK